MNTSTLTLSPKERWEILHRDGFACRYCGARAPEARLHVDHVLARALGGTNDPSNLATACELCNQGKSDSPFQPIRDQRLWAISAMLFWDMCLGLPDGEAVRNALTVVAGICRRSKVDPFSFARKFDGSEDFHTAFDRLVEMAGLDKEYGRRETVQ